MTIRTLTITSHPSTTEDVFVRDMGFSVPAGGVAPIVIEDSPGIELASMSSSLRELATNEAFGAQQSSLFLTDRTPIPMDSVSARLSALTRFDEDWLVMADNDVVTVDGNRVIATGP